MTARLVTMDSEMSSEPPGVRTRSGIPLSRRSPNARVDNTLVRREELREQVRSVWREIKELRRPGLRAIRDLARVVRSGGPEAAEELLGLYLAEQSEAHSRTARMVLEGIAPDVLEPLIAECIGRDGLPSSAFDRLNELHLCGFGAAEPGGIFEMIAERQTASDLIGEYEDLLRVAGDANAESRMLVWQRAFRHFSADDRAVILEEYCAERADECLPVLELESWSRDVSVRRIVAAHLGEIRSVDAAAIANRLSNDPDIIVRYDAEQAVQNLRRARHLAPAVTGEFYSCRALLLPAAGLAMALWGVRDTATGKISFACFTLDTWHRGVLDVWGNLGQTPELFEDLTRSVLNVMTGRLPAACDAGRGPVSLNADQGAALILGAAAVGETRGFCVAREFPVWRRLVSPFGRDRGERRSGQKSAIRSFVFGLTCRTCGREVSANRWRTNVALVRDGALCRHCRTAT